MCRSRPNTVARVALALVASVALYFGAGPGAGGIAIAQALQAGALKIGQPYARATPPGAVAAGAFLRIENTGKLAERLLRASSPVAGVVELHEMTMEGNVMKMRAVSGIEIKPGATVALQPGGYHVMLLGLKQPLAQGERIPLTLTFEKAGSVDVVVNVEAMGATGHAPH